MPKHNDRTEPSLLLRETAFLLLAALTLTGCGGRRGLSRAEKLAAEAEPTLTILWQRGDAANKLQQLCDKYRDNTGIKVVVSQAFTSEFEKIADEALARQQPTFDLIVGKAHWMARYVPAGHYVDLSTFLKRDVGMTDIHPSVRATISEFPSGSANFYAVPCYPDPMGLVYRRDWFDNASHQKAFETKYGYKLVPPETWKQLVDIATYFNVPAKDQGTHGLLMLSGREAGGLAWSADQILYSLGGQWADPDTNKLRGNMNSPQVLKTIELLRSLILTGPPHASDADTDTVITSFLQGNTAMAITCFSSFPGIVSDLGSSVAFAPLPSGPDGKRVATLQGYGISVLSRLPVEQHDLALAFIQWFMAPDTRRAWADLTGITYSLSYMAQATGIPKSPYAESYAATLDVLKRFWDTPMYATILASIEKYVGDAVDGYMDPQVAVDRLTDDCTDLLIRHSLLIEF